MDLQIKKLIIYLILSFYTVPQFSLDLKQAVLVPVEPTLNKLWNKLYFFLFFTWNVNFLKTSQHIQADIWPDIN